MLRRSHKKSRKGAKCNECRRRHIRCDQQRPICVNCAQADRLCSYTDATVRQESSSPDQPPNRNESSIEAEAEQSISPSMTHLPGTANPDTLRDASAVDDAGVIVNITHLELFHHFGEIVGPLFAGKDPDLCRDYVTTYQKAAFSGVYLMHEILAFSATHLSITGQPSRAESYTREATVLQTRALSLFNTSLQHPESDTIVATFLFSSLLGTHLLSDTIVSRHMDLDSFLGHFVRYLKVHRGVRPIFDEYRPVLLNSELRPFLVWGWNLSKMKGTGLECQLLREMIARGTLDTLTAEAYAGAIDLLQTIIDGYKNRPAFPGPAPWVSIWLSMVRPEYTELLIARQPEALVIFAYYGAMIHCYHRDLWLVGENGKHIIELVTNSLGEEWAHWLQWPHQIVQFSQDFEFSR